MFRKAGMLLTAMMIAGCVSSPEALVGQGDTLHRQLTFNENYQEVYRRLAETAARCRSTAGSAAFTVDRQVYNELGYGTVSLSLVSIYGRNFYWNAKVAKAGSGSRVDIAAGNSLGKQSFMDDVVRWAKGDKTC